MIYAVTHDLQAPVRHIRSFLDVLRQHPGCSFDEEANGVVDRIDTAVETLQERLDALTRFSQVVARGAEPVDCDAGELVVDALALLDDKVRATGAQVTVGELPRVVADRTQLTTVLVELIDNALKFSGDAPHVRIGATRHSDGFMFSVDDDGPGFNTRDIADAFDLFRRFHPMSIPGTGTGLAIVKRIVERHGHEVEIISGPGAGTSVRFSLSEGDGE